MIEKVTDLAKNFLRAETNVDIAVDMTSGNGFDSKFILDTLKPKKLYAFDIQKDAMANSKSLIGSNKAYNFILDSHEYVDKYIKEEIDLAIYNLGYLPKGDKNITTRVDTTLTSLEKVLKLLKKSGKVYITVYPGHSEGQKESKALDSYLESLNQKNFVVLKFTYPNQINNPPYLYLVGKK